MNITATEFLKGISHELRFWQGFVKTERFLKGWVRNVKTPELNQAVYDFIRDHNSSRTLDVGSGVVSILNGSILKPDELIAVDPLGEMYELVFDYQRHGIKSPLPFPAEELPYENEFDIVHISNAIDHSQNPFEAFQKLLRACKPGGYLIIQGFENEATFENHQGFHQYDIFLNKQNELICNMQLLRGETAVSVAHAERIEFEQKTWFIWICQK